jgi:anti-anti-sigma factor
LRDRVYSALARRQRKLLLNLNDVVRIDAAGLGALADVRQMAAIVDAAVTLTNVHPRVRELVVLVGLGAHFDIVASESDGLEDFEPCGAGFRN